MLFIIGIALGGAVVIFALQNLAPVMVTFLGWSFEGSIALIVLAALFSGVVISLLFSLSSFISGMMAQSKLKGHNEALRKDLDQHKEMLQQAHQKIVDIERVEKVEDKPINNQF
jgi:uncharacterized integral membrane protein